MKELNRYLDLSRPPAAEGELIILCTSCGLRREFVEGTAKWVDYVYDGEEFVCEGCEVQP